MTRFDDLGQVTETVDFQYAEIDTNCFGNKQTQNDGLEAACECQRQIWAWVYQPPCEDIDGFICRCIVASWIFVPQLRDYTMTEIAGRFGKKKQSLGRWVADFKRQFHAVANHLQHLRTT